MGAGDANRLLRSDCPHIRYNRHRLSVSGVAVKISLTVDRRMKPILHPVTSHPYDGGAVFYSRHIGFKGIESWDERNVH